jgi:hypothetical protein
MNKIIELPCSKSVELFNGFYARVARDLGVDASYVSRITREKRKSIVVERALNREFRKCLFLITNGSPLSAKNRSKRSRTMFQNDRLRHLIPFLNQIPKRST